MQTFVEHRGIALPLLVNNIDTDQIIPSREMKKVSRTGLADGLFSGQRYLYDGDEKVGKNPQFIMNQSPYDQATIILGRKNFGCGSSREHAVWSLLEYGIRAIIAESFGGIFRNNCIRNGLLPITLPAAQLDILIAKTGSKPLEEQITIDLRTRSLHLPSGDKFDFEIEDYCQAMLLNGWDFIDLALQHEEKIESFVNMDRNERPWAYLTN